MKIGIFTILFMIKGLLFCGFIFFSVFTDTETKKIDCFDKHGNKIVDQVCLDEPLTDTEKFLVIILGIFSLIFLIFLGSLLDILSKNNKSHSIRERQK